MKTSLTTFELSLREWLLNLVHEQWRALGVPFSAPQPPRTIEVIDPEALLWCSLEFFPTQPRLCEQVLAWWASNDPSLLRPRIRKFAQVRPDPRGFIWHALDPQWKESPKELTESIDGQAEELLQFCGDIGKKALAAKRQRHQPGAPERTPATVILRARDAVGTDARHFILVYLLANRSGAKLRSIAAWSGQSYRNISKVTQRWQSANILSLEHGFARLRNPAIWETVLELEPAHIALLNWLRFYDACINLLRSLSKVATKSLPADGPVVTALIREAAAEAAASVEGDPSTPAGTVQDLTQLLAGLR